MIELKRESVILIQSLEGLVPSNLSKRVHLERASWNSLAVIFNLSDSPCKSIEFSNMLRRKNETVIDSNAFRSARDKDSIKLSSEVALHFIELFFMLLYDIRKLGKNE
jgi:hypothetical protein